MVVLEVERWRCGLLGYKKRKRRRRKSCLWAGLIHRGEDSTKSGLKDEKCKKKPACGHGAFSVGKIPGQYQPIPYQPNESITLLPYYVRTTPKGCMTRARATFLPRFFKRIPRIPPFGHTTSEVRREARKNKKGEENPKWYCTEESGDKDQYENAGDRRNLISRPRKMRQSDNLGNIKMENNETKPFRRRWCVETTILLPFVCFFDRERTNDRSCYSGAGGGNRLHQAWAEQWVNSTRLWRAS